MLLKFISFRTKFCSLVFFRDSLSGSILQTIQQDSFANSPLLWSARPSVVRLKCHNLRASSPFGDIVKSRRARDTREETRKRGPSRLILGDPGEVSRVGRKGGTNVFKYGRKSPWVPTLTKLFPKIQVDAGS